MMKIRLLAYIVLLFAIELMYPLAAVQSVVIGFTQLLANCVASLVGLFDSHLVQHGVQLMHSQSERAIRVDESCNAIQVLLLLYAGILVYPAGWREKLAGLAGGFVGIQVINILRIISLYYLVDASTGWFDFIHQYLWRYLIALDVLACFGLWVIYCHKKNAMWEEPAR